MGGGKAWQRGSVCSTRSKSAFPRHPAQHTLHQARPPQAITTGGVGVGGGGGGGGGALRSTPPRTCTSRAAKSHTRTVLSSETVTAKRPLRVTAAACTAPEWPSSMHCRSPLSRVKARAVPSPAAVGEGQEADVVLVGLEKHRRSAPPSCQGNGGRSSAGGQAAPLVPPSCSRLPPSWWPPGTAWPPGWQART